MNVLGTISWFVGGLGVAAILISFFGALLCAAGRSEDGDNSGNKFYRWIFFVGISLIILFIVLRLIIFISGLL